MSILCLRCCQVGQINDFVELANYPEFTKHLESYGLLNYDEFRLPKVAIPVVGRYVGLEFANREGRKNIYRIVEQNYREPWLQKRLGSILHDFRFLEKLIQKAGVSLLFGANSFPEADAFANIKVCECEDNFDVFINTCNRCFVELIENFGRSIGKPDYFWNEIKIKISKPVVRLT